MIILVQKYEFYLIPGTKRGSGKEKEAKSRIQEVKSQHLSHKSHLRSQKSDFNIYFSLLEHQKFAWLPVGHILDIRF